MLVTIVALAPLLSLLAAYQCEKRCWWKMYAISEWLFIISALCAALLLVATAFRELGVVIEIHPR